MKHLLGTQGLSREDAIALLDTAEEMLLTQEREQRKLATLRAKTVVNLFYEDSTRTRISFEVAEKRLSADVINFSAKGSSVSKGESLKDTAQTLEAIGADAIVVRHPSSGAPENLAHSGWISASIINAGDGRHEHPTQALLDAFTIRKRLFANESRGKALDGRSVVIVGDIAHSRVARSNMWLLHTLGAKVTFVAPETLTPFGARQWHADVTHNFDDALTQLQPDVVMMLRVQLERMQASYFPSPHEYARNWGLNEARFAMLKPTAVVMHPGPMNRGVEICSKAADAPQSAVLDQVSYGVAVRMAVLYSLLAPRKDNLS